MWSGKGFRSSTSQPEREREIEISFQRIVHIYCPVIIGWVGEEGGIGNLVHVFLSKLKRSFED